MDDGSEKAEGNNGGHREGYRDDVGEAIRATW